MSRLVYSYQNQKCYSPVHHEWFFTSNIICSLTFGAIDPISFHHASSSVFPLNLKICLKIGLLNVDLFYLQNNQCILLPATVQLVVKSFCVFLPLRNVPKAKVGALPSWVLRHQPESRVISHLKIELKYKEDFHCSGVYQLLQIVCHCKSVVHYVLHVVLTPGLKREKKFWCEMRKMK